MFVTIDVTDPVCGAEASDVVAIVVRLRIFMRSAFVSHGPLRPRKAFDKCIALKPIDDFRRIRIEEQRNLLRAHLPVVLNKSLYNVKRFVYRRANTPCGLFCHRSLGQSIRPNGNCSISDGNTQRHQIAWNQPRERIDLELNCQRSTCENITTEPCE